ncbi:hypothetical protein LILAB_21940 [Corallococcus macrosporus]|uniref:Uncharacterized protein n=1 Tax=Myxococcus fulvus (strain ATCC BAA-855 / HW-1) TaxID=483219 RepID=F8CHG9_MYXFH|nr:hypothetical protein LILAB_21940 [Corallococcus macrosporus]
MGLLEPGLPGLDGVRHCSQARQNQSEFTSIR